MEFLPSLPVQSLLPVSAWDDIIPKHLMATAHNQHVVLMISKHVLFFSRKTTYVTKVCTNQSTGITANIVFLAAT